MKASALGATFASLPPAWAAVLPGWTRARFDEVQRCIEAASGDRPIAPDDPFRAFRLVLPDQVKVVIVGQDPYPTAGHADGLAFSAGKGKPRSLARIFQVLAADRPASFRLPDAWNLDDWARRGVLLLNPVLTVEIGRSASHMDCNWQALTRQVVEVLTRFAEPPIFLLWGSKAQAFWSSASTSPTAKALFARHPSYDFQRQFMADGSHFEATSEQIDWWAIGREELPVL